MRQKLIILLLINLSFVIPVFNAQGIERWKGETIRIRKDGSIEPRDAPLKREGNVYTLMADIETISENGIIVEKDDIIIEGNGHLLKKLGQVSNVYNCGICLESRKNIKIRDIEIQNFGTGILIIDSSSNEISRCNVIENEGYGIFLTRSSNNKIIENNIIRDRAGLWLIDSSNNQIAKNKFIDCSLFVAGAYRNTVIDNTVNGKPLVYIERENGKTISNVEVGQVILVNCINITVEGLRISNGSIGIELWETEYSVLKNNIIEKNLWGIYLGKSKNNLIIQNILTKNFGNGILLVFNSSNNQVIANDIINNSIGIWLVDSSDNKIHGNNFVDNLKQVYTVRSVNAWSYDSRGNYWSDYNGVDANRDGIGDIPYVIDDKNKDIYPLIKFLLKISSPYGIVAGSGWYKAGETVRVSVSPSVIDHGNRTRRVFKGWFEGGSLLSCEETFALTVDKPRTIVAGWMKEYLLEARSIYGAVTGSGWYEPGATVRISVSPTIDYGNGTRRVFKGWFEDNSLVSTEESFTVTVDKPRILVADWVKEYKVDVHSDHGTANGGGWYSEGSTAAISVSQTVIDYGNGTRRIFNAWLEKGYLLSIRESFTITVDKPRTIVAGWVKEYEIKVLSERGTVAGSGWYKAGETVRVSVSPTRSEELLFNYIFEGWRTNGKIISTSPTFFFTVEKPVTLTASWRLELNAMGFILGIFTAIIVLTGLLAVILYYRRREEELMRREIYEKIEKVKRFLET